MPTKHTFCFKRVIILISLIILYKYDTVYGQIHEERFKQGEIKKGSFVLSGLGVNDNYVLKKENIEDSVITYISIQDIVSKQQSNIKKGYKCGKLEIYHSPARIKDSIYLSGQFSRLHINPLLMINNGSKLSYAIPAHALNGTINNLQYDFSPFYGGTLNILPPECEHKTCKYWTHNVTELKVDEIGESNGVIQFENLDYAQLSNIALISTNGQPILNNESLEFRTKANYSDPMNLNINIHNGIIYFDNLEINYNSKITFKPESTLPLMFGNLYVEFDSLEIDSIRLTFTQDSVFYSFFGTNIYGKKINYSNNISIEAELISAISIKEIVGRAGFSTIGIDLRNTILKEVKVENIKLESFKDNLQQPSFIITDGSISIHNGYFSVDSSDVVVSIVEANSSYADINGNKASFSIDKFVMHLNEFKNSTDGYGYSQFSNVEYSFPSQIDANSISIPIPIDNLDSFLSGKLKGKEYALLANPAFTSLYQEIKILNNSKVLSTDIEFNKSIPFTISGQIPNVSLLVKFTGNKLVFISETNSLDATLNIPEHRDQYDIYVDALVKEFSIVTRTKNYIEKFGFLGKAISKTVFWQEELITWVTKRVPVPISLYIPENHIDVQVTECCVGYNNGKFVLEGGHLEKISPILFSPTIKLTLPFGGDVIKEPFDRYTNAIGLNDPVGLATRMIFNLYVLIDQTDNLFGDTNNTSRQGLELQLPYDYKVCRNLQDQFSQPVINKIQILKKTY